MQKRKSSFFTCLGFSVVLFLGCDTVEEATDGGITPDGEAADMKIIKSDASVTPAKKYLFVQITDLSDGTKEGTDGADIDAVELMKTAGSTWAKSVASCQWNDDSACTNQTAAVGESDAFCGDPIDYARCFSNLETTTPAPYVSLGGTVGDKPGSLVVEMAEAIVEGDSLVIYELGNCAVSASCTDAETVNAAADLISVSIGETATGPWVEILATSTAEDHPTITVVVPALPTT